MALDARYTRFYTPAPWDVKAHTMLPTSECRGAGAQRAAERGDDEQVGQEAAHVAHPEGEVVDAVELPVQRQPRRVSRQRRQRLPRRAQPDCPRARWQPVACRLLTRFGLGYTIS